MGNARDDEGNDDGDDVSHREAGDRDFVRVVEGLIGADRGDWIQNRGREHVGEGATDREAVFDKAADDGDDSAFADWEDGTEEAAHENGEGAVFREEFFESTAREIGP